MAIVVWSSERIYKWFVKEEFGILSWLPFYLWCSSEPEILHSIPIPQCITCVSSCLSSFIRPATCQHQQLCSSHLLLVLELSEFNHRHCRSALFGHGVCNSSLEAASRELPPCDLQPGHDKHITRSQMEARKRECYSLPLPVLCRMTAVTQWFISEVLFNWTQSLATSDTELGHAYAVGSDLSCFADLSLHFPMQVQTQVRKTAVNKVGFSPLGLTDCPSTFHRPSGTCISRQESTGLVLGTGPFAFLQLQWSPLTREWPFPVFWHFLIPPLKWLLSKASFQSLALCKICQHLIKAQNRNRMA